MLKGFSLCHQFGRLFLSSRYREKTNGVQSREKEETSFYHLLLPLTALEAVFLWRVSQPEEHKLLKKEGQGLIEEKRTRPYRRQSCPSSASS